MYGKALSGFVDARARQEYGSVSNYIRMRTIRHERCYFDCSQFFFVESNAVGKLLIL
jgi:hypothetical protein